MISESVKKNRSIWKRPIEEVGRPERKTHQCTDGGLGQAGGCDDAEKWTDWKWFCAGSNETST